MSTEATFRWEFRKSCHFIVLVAVQSYVLLFGEFRLPSPRPPPTPSFRTARNFPPTTSLSQRTSLWTAPLWCQNLWNLNSFESNSTHGWNADANDGTHHSIARVLLDHDDFNFIFLGKLNKRKYFLHILMTFQTGRSVREQLTIWLPVTVSEKLGDSLQRSLTGFLSTTWLTSTK